MADNQRRIARQTQILQDAQKRLERMDRAREQMVRQVEREAQILDEMLKAQDEVQRNLDSMRMTPQLDTSAPAVFKSQFDQFEQTRNLQRLSPEASSGMDFSGKLKPPAEDKPVFSMGDNAEHWRTLAENPGRPIYVSGRYVSTGNGTFALSSPKAYEYEVSASALPLSVGDTVRVPVHPTGHGRGEAFTTGHLQLRIDDIYTKARFHEYHDRIEE